MHAHPRPRRRQPPAPPAPGTSAGLARAARSPSRLTGRAASAMPAWAGGPAPAGPPGVLSAAVLACTPVTARGSLATSILRTIGKEADS